MGKPHAICIPYPAQGHINPMFKVAKLLHSKGFHITFVHTIYNYNRLLKSLGPNSMDGLSDFVFEKIPDGLPPVDGDATQDIPTLCEYTSKYCLDPFRDLITRLNSGGVPPVSCIVSDGCMSFTVEAAEEFEVPIVLFWTTSACGFLGYVHYKNLLEKGVTPLKDEKCLINGHLDTTTIEWIPSMKNIRLRDLPSFVRTIDPDDLMLNFLNTEAQKASKATAIIINTFQDLEANVISDLSSILKPPIYTIGPLQLLLQNTQQNDLSSLGSNLWKDEPKCLTWLDSKDPKSVLVVNFGSITVMSSQQMVEFAWGLANSGFNFLWIIRPDLVKGESAMLPNEFVEVTKDRGLLASWCKQEEVLNHPAIGGFLTHCGWNSMLESVCGGVPVICWPFFAEQTNCWFSCREWGIGMEIDNDVKRDEVEKLVRELMVGEKSEEMRKKVLEWKKKAMEASSLYGDSYLNFNRLVEEILLSKK